jgi:large subunit ribosomal protein L9
MNIEVVLTENDPKLGQRGQVIKVSSGYAYNFLIPNKKAKLATPSNLKNFEAEKARQAKEETEAKARADEMAKKIAAASLTLEMLAGDGDKLFGAVTAQDIQQGLMSLGIAVDRKGIHLEEPIKKIGATEVTIKLNPQIQVKLKLWIVKKKN